MSIYLYKNIQKVYKKWKKYLNRYKFHLLLNEINLANRTIHLEIVDIQYPFAEERIKIYKKMAKEIRKDFIKNTMFNNIIVNYYN